MAEWTKKQIETARELDDLLGQVELFLWDDPIRGPEGSGKVVKGLRKCLIETRETAKRLPPSLLSTQELVGVLGRFEDEVNDMEFDIAVSESSYERSEVLHDLLRRFGCRNLPPLRELRHRLAYQAKIAEGDKKPSGKRRGRPKSPRKKKGMEIIRELAGRGITDPPTIILYMTRRHSMAGVKAEHIKEWKRCLKRGDLDAK